MINKNPTAKPAKKLSDLGQASLDLASKTTSRDSTKLPSWSTRVRVQLLIRFIPVIIWMILIFFLSHSDASSSTSHSDGAIEALLGLTGIELSELVIRKLAHGFIYLVLGILVMYALLPLNRFTNRPSHSPAIAGSTSGNIDGSAISNVAGSASSRAKTNYSLSALMLTSLVISILYATSDELHQTFIPGRSGEFSDVIIDSTSALVGILTVALLRKRAG